MWLVQYSLHKEQFAFTRSHSCGFNYHLHINDSQIYAFGPGLSPEPMTQLDLIVSQAPEDQRMQIKLIVSTPTLLDLKFLLI